MVRYLAWENSHSGPVASIWNGKLTDGNGKDRPNIKLVELAADDIRTIDELKLAYPIEVKE